MAQEHLQLAPHKVSNDFWWYEENKGIAVCVRAFDENGIKQTFVRYIPWSCVRAGLKRKDKK